jgi:hypothetical protein
LRALDCAPLVVFIPEVGADVAGSTSGVWSLRSAMPGDHGCWSAWTPQAKACAPACATKKADVDSCLSRAVRSFLIARPAIPASACRSLVARPARRSLRAAHLGGSEQCVFNLLGTLRAAVHASSSHPINANRAVAASRSALTTQNAMRNGDAKIGKLLWSRLSAVSPVGTNSSSVFAHETIGATLESASAGCETDQRDAEALQN